MNQSPYQPVFDAVVPVLAPWVPYVITVVMLLAIIGVYSNDIKRFFR